MESMNTSLIYKQENLVKEYYFMPLASLVVVIFVGFFILALIIAKIFLNSSTENISDNRYDLIIFKKPNKNSMPDPRRLLSSNNANQHNVNAAEAAGFDMSTLYISNNDPFRRTSHSHASRFMRNSITYTN
jgi:hypothetical protein